MARKKLQGNIYLTGFMGAGKTTVGRILAERLGWCFTDIDGLIEEREGATVSEIFAHCGEPRFRQLEAFALERASGWTGHVVSTGGGIVLKDENRKLMRATGVTVYLKTPAHLIEERLSGDDSRPLLMVEDPKSRIRELLAEREALYEQADITVDTSGRSPEEVAEEILARLGEGEQRGGEPDTEP